jgi:quercetin dioxygenase-like cupin family protein
MGVCAIAGLGSLLAGCSDGNRPPTAVERANEPAPPLASVGAAQLEPFTSRATIEPYRIMQLPSFMMQSYERSDIVMQRSVFTPGTGGWHTHAGPSFVHVLQGRIKLEEYSSKEGCVETPVRGPGEVYFEEGGHVHRAIVVSSESAVLLVTRFNIPPGSPITLSASAPAC